MHIEGEPIIAQCYLQKGADNANVCYLSEQKLFVKQFNRMHVFPLESILAIEFKHKLLLFPLIIGGIMSPLSLIALFNEILNTWLMMGAFVGGLLILYYGVEGSNTMTVVTSIKEFDFFLRAPSKNLKAFISFVLKYGKRGIPIAYFLLVTEQEWSQAQQAGSLHLQEPRELLEDKVTKQGMITLRLEPLDSGIAVNYIYSKNGALIPSIQGLVPIAGLEEFSS